MASASPHPISPNISSRTGRAPGSSQLVAQQVKIHTHQTPSNSRSVSSAPSQLGCASKP